MQAALRNGLTARSSFAARSSVVRRSIVSVAPRPSLVSSYAAPSCSFLGGGSMTPSSMFRPQPAKGRGALVVVANAKKSMGCTLRGTRRARARTSGFRARMASAAGRKVLAARRKRGRKALTPASQKLSGGKK